MNLTKDLMPYHDTTSIILTEPAARVLLIDTDTGESGNLSHALIQAGYEVAVAETPQAGVEMARDYHPDAVLFSPHGPQIDSGIETCAQLKTKPELAGVPLLVIEDPINIHDQQAFDVGIEEFIPKQSGPDGALLRLKQTLLKKRVTEQLRTDLHRVAIELETARESKDSLLRKYQQAQEKLAELEMENEELRNENRMRASFINAVVHDIRSPLTVILGSIDLVAEEVAAGRPLDNQHYGRLLNDSLRCCQEVSNLVNDMLMLAQMQKQKLSTLNFEKISITDVVKQAMELASGAARQAGIDLSQSVKPELPRLFIDRPQMHRALMNLVNNAIKFTPRGGEVKIQVRLLEEKEKRRDAMYDYVLVSVIDTGEGLSPEETPYIFDAYWQAANGKRKLGTGLGLSIVKRIAVAHGGNVSVRSIPGKGSTFTIMIPILNEPPSTKIQADE